MIGAIIGDWAAWTWGQNKETFFRQLVSSEASSSWMVVELLRTADTLVQERGRNNKAHECLGKRQSPVATVMRAIAIGWLFDTEAETASAYQEYGFTYAKEDWYIQILLNKIRIIERWNH